jgi:hypothetical protein
MVAQKNLALLAILNKGAAKRSRAECHFIERHVVYGQFSQSAFHRDILSREIN